MVTCSLYNSLLGVEKRMLIMTAHQDRAHHIELCDMRQVRGSRSAAATPT